MDKTKYEMCEKFKILGKKKLVKSCKGLVDCQCKHCQKEIDEMKKLKGSKKMDKIKSECIKKHNKIEDVGLCIYKKTPKKDMKIMTEASQKVINCQEKKCKKEMGLFAKSIFNSMIKKKNETKKK